MSLSLKKEKLEAFFLFSLLTNELMDMEAAPVFVKNLLESTGYFLLLKTVVFLILYSVSLVLISSSS